MAKKPVAGAVKSRLAKDIGVMGATRFYRTVMAQTIRRLAGDPRWQTRLAVSPATAPGDAVWPRNVLCEAQSAGGLGQRMQHILDSARPGPVVIIGTDIPGISRRDIARAFFLLGENDVVFGPASDGGYWLVGARRSPKVPDLFGNVRWSGEHALADTLRNADGLKVGFAAQKTDVDCGADLAGLAGRLPGMFTG
ncbi:MAG TPA: glycosyltransferase [Rhizobiales bacterium]|nr:glycosyltransferase [Hyphomicrobiales bacterium]